MTSSQRQTLNLLPCIDSPEMAAARRAELDIARDRARMLGWTAVEAAEKGYYIGPDDENVDWRQQVDSAISGRQSISPEDALPARDIEYKAELRIQVANETTLQAGRRLVTGGVRTLALNFANGVNPGGGFLNGARAQEEVLCRSSALFDTLVDDPMYEHHKERHFSDSTSWTIHSPDVPVFRTDDGTALAEPWLLSFLTCAAPYAPHVGQPMSGDLLEQRIHRVLAIASAFGYETLVLGAWGCGAFGNDPQRTAEDFRNALENEFEGHFAEVVFAITDWSAGRHTLGPFREVFSA